MDGMHVWETSIRKITKRKIVKSFWLLMVVEGLKQQLNDDWKREEFILDAQE
jgi:hypothetical protein